MNILENRLQTVRDVVVDIRKTHEQIIAGNDSAVEAYIRDNVFPQMITVCEDALDFLMYQIGQGSVASASANSSHLVNSFVCVDEDFVRAAKLPKLELPTFSGEYED